MSDSTPTPTPAPTPGIRERLVDLSGDDELLFADGFDGAIIGLVERCSQPLLVCYDYHKAVQILADSFADPDLAGDEHAEERMEMAEEFLQFNTLGAWVGERTPVWLVIRRKDCDE